MLFLSFLFSGESVIDLIDEMMNHRQQYIIDVVDNVRVFVLTPIAAMPGEMKPVMVVVAAYF